MVQRDDEGVLLGRARDEGERRPDRVGRLARHVDRGLARGAVDVGDAATGLQGSGVAAWIEGVQPDHLVRLRERVLGPLLVVPFPLVAVGALLALLALPDQRTAA